MSLPHLRFLAPAIVMLPFSKAAEIDWQAPFNITSVNSIDTNGTLLQAVNATTDGNSPTITVAGEAILFSGSPIGPHIE